MKTLALELEKLTEEQLFTKYGIDINISSTPKHELELIIKEIHKRQQ